MRILGVLGGMGWASTLEAYRLLNRGVAMASGGDHGAELLIRSIDFARVHALQRDDDWEGAARLLSAAATDLRRAGAGALLLCTNTMHRVADQVEQAAGIPLIHIADATAAAVLAGGCRTVGLLGTRYTMEGAFYADRLRDHGLSVVIPPPEDRQLVHEVIYDELVREVITEDSRTRFLRVIDRMRERQVDGVIAGCTEIELLVTADDVDLPWFPTAALHARAGVRWLLDGQLPTTPAGGSDHLTD